MLDQILQMLLRNMAASWASELSLLSALALRNWYAVTLKMLRSDFGKKGVCSILCFDHQGFLCAAAE